MNADSAFYTGKNHPVCQDYALHSESPTSHVIVCDGCSGSPMTDIGARLLALQARKHMFMFDSHLTLKHDEVADFAAKSAVMEAEKQVDDMRINRRCLDATLLVAAVIEGQVYIRAWGDGVFVIKRKDEDPIIVTLDYNDFPYYLNYINSPERLANWEKSSKQEISCKVQKLTTNGLIDYELSELKLPGNNRCSSVALPIDNLEYVTIMSDGVHTYNQIVDGAGQSIARTDVFAELLGYKSHTGEFVTRRMQMFHKLKGRRGWRHGDDVSVAAIGFGE